MAMAILLVSVTKFYGGAILNINSKRRLHFCDLAMPDRFNCPFEQLKDEEVVFSDYVDVKFYINECKIEEFDDMKDLLITREDLHISKSRDDRLWHPPLKRSEWGAFSPDYDTD